jgi:transposase
LGRRALASDQKKAETEGRTIVWVDESGFYLLPAVVRTYAPSGQTPILRAKLSYDHLSVISGLTPEGRLLMQVQRRAYTSVTVVGFLKHLLRHIPGKLLIIWDGAPIHRGQPIKEFLAQGGAARIHLEHFPAYAPEVNPDEGIWCYLKRVELRNLVCHTLDELHYELRLATARIRHKPEVLSGCIRHAGLTV